MKDGVGYDASTCSDRVDTIEDLIAKDDRVWAVWTMRGTHTGQLFGIPATGQPIEILEAGSWRLVDGLVIEAWFFGDELRLLRQYSGYMSTFGAANVTEIAQEAPAAKYVDSNGNIVTGADAGVSGDGMSIGGHDGGVGRRRRRRRRRVAVAAAKLPAPEVRQSLAVNDHELASGQNRVPSRSIPRMAS
jgi:hypothetical protein